MKISIIIATYNRRNLLRQCLNAVLFQTYKDMEVLVIDDGSTDKTRQLFDHEFTDSRIKYIRLEKNSGATTARNKGLDEMTGDAFVIWDSDDELYPNAIERLAQILDENPAYGIVTAPGLYVKNGNTLEHKRLPSQEITFCEKLRGKLPKDECVWLVRSASVKNLRFEGRNQDFIFADHVASQCRWYHLDEYLAKINILADEQALTKQRKVPNIAWAIERTEPLLRYLDDFHAPLRACAPKRLAQCTYGAMIGLLLSGDRKRACAVGKNFKDSEKKWNHVCLYVCAHVPFFTIVFNNMFRAKIYIHNKLNTTR